MARRMAEEAGLDWQAITGTGPRGQITREDVESALERRSGGAEEPRGGGAEAASQLPTSSFQQLVSSNQLPASSFQLSGIRALIAERMVAGHSQTAPVTLTSEADATALVELRRQLAADDVAVSYNDLFLTVLAKALAEHPRLNTSLDGDAVGSGRKWTSPSRWTPNAACWRRWCAGRPASGWRSLLRRPRRWPSVPAGQVHARRADRQHLHADQPGDVRHRRVHADHQPARVRDLGVGRIKTQPVWVADHVEPRQMVWLSLTFDHRLVDGGPARCPAARCAVGGEAAFADGVTRVKASETSQTSNHVMQIRPDRCLLVTRYSSLVTRLISRVAPMSHSPQLPRLRPRCGERPVRCWDGWRTDGWAFRRCTVSPTARYRVPDKAGHVSLYIGMSCICGNEIQQGIALAGPRGRWPASAWTRGVWISAC